MASSSLIPFGICLLLLFSVSFAQLERQQQNIWQRLRQQQQHRLRAKTQCNIQRLSADEPSRRFESEAGVTEFWESNREEFQCAGVEVERRSIQPRGLSLPHYTNAPKLVYIVQGNGVQGTVFPGCAETFECQPGISREEERAERQRSADRHQKLRRIREGDIVALPAGVTHWLYNDGEVPLVAVSLLDVANEANQLDLNFRHFFLAGNPQRGRQSRFHQSQEEARREQEGEQSGDRRNIFNGFDDELLADAFNVDPQIIRQLKSQDDQRGTIVRAERLELVLPEDEQERQHQPGGGGWPLNGLEETLCTVKLRENIGHPRRADLFNPRAGRISTANSQTLPVLQLLQLSAERGHLYSNALVSPHWTINAHSILYVIRGNARIQVVGNNGNSVFDDQVREGQLLIVPQNFAVVKRAGDQGFEYITFKTNDNAMSSPLAGRLSTFRSFPEEVLMNSYRINREQARNLKNNRQEAVLFSSSRGRREYEA